jgi:hypothetical protein
LHVVEQSWEKATEHRRPSAKLEYSMFPGNIYRMGSFRGNEIMSLASCGLDGIDHS